jgi:hypothetical protein
VQWLGHLLPPVSDLLQGFVCVCTQVSGSVVSNWPLCEFCGRVYCDIWYIFLIRQFLRHQTMNKVQKHNSFNTNTPSSESYRNKKILHSGEGKVRPCLCLPKFHSMKTYWGSGSIAAGILDFETRWKWVVSFTPGRFTPPPPSYSLRYLWDRRLGGSHSQAAPILDFIAKDWKLVCLCWSVLGADRFVHLTVYDWLLMNYINEEYNTCYTWIHSSSFLGSTAQLRPWPPQNPAEFLGGFSTIFYRVGFLALRPTPIPEDQTSVFILLQKTVRISQILLYSRILVIGDFCFFTKCVIKLKTEVNQTLKEIKCKGKVR